MEDQRAAQRRISDGPHRPFRRALSADVQIRLEPGYCYVETGALFSSLNDDLIRRFIDRTFRIPAVSMVNVDREHETLGIRFDETGRNPRDVLREIATGLLEDPNITHDSVFCSFLARIPGYIHRIERQFQPGTELFTVVSEGDGFVARSQQCLGKMALVSGDDAAFQAADGEKTGAPADRVLVVAQEIVVEYDGNSAPVMAETLDALSQSGGIVALGTRSTIQHLDGRRLDLVENVLHYGRRLARLSADLGSGTVAWLEAQSPVGATKWLTLKLDGWLPEKLVVRAHRATGDPRREPAIWAENKTLAWSLNSKLRLLAAAGLLAISFSIAGFAGAMLIALGALGAVALWRLPTLRLDHFAGGQLATVT